MNGNLQLTLPAAAFFLMLAGSSSAEKIQGNLKALASDSKVFTIESQPGKALFIIYNKDTKWINISTPAELDPDDSLTIEFNIKDSQNTATSVSRAVTYYPPDIKYITTESLATTLDANVSNPPFVLIDTRPSELFEAAHLKGAISIPLSRLIKRSPGLLPQDRDTQLIFYDHGAGANDAAKSAGLATGAGYRNIYIYPDGIRGWVKSGRIALSSPTFIRKKSPILIDLRNEDQVALGHLDGAVNISAANLSAKMHLFPMDKRLPIVLYGADDNQALDAARTIRGWGYRNVTIFSGGITAWLESAEVLSLEPAADFIVSANSAHSGKLPPRDFELALRSPMMVEIVDVRSTADYQKGNFPASKHIPLEELPQRHGELNKEKIQVIFGADAMHAEIAYDFLSQLGYRLSYLHGSVEFTPGGKHLTK